jgi:hypothetical protein
MTSVLSGQICNYIASLGVQDFNYSGRKATNDFVAIQGERNGPDCQVRG